MVLSPEHSLVESLTSDDCKAAVLAYQDLARKKSDLERTELAKEKTGVFTGAYAINPANGQKAPIWIADYVLATYGTGAIMAVPAHDERDFAFAKAYNLPIIEVVKPKTGITTLPDAAYAEEGISVNSNDLNGLETPEAKKKISAQLEKMGAGKMAVSYRLRDWLFSRQRYWGEPIPLVHCKKCGIVAVPEEQLPVVLPEVDKYEPSGTGESPLATISSWVNTTCPSCGGPAKRETNTMPQWAGSCWYYLRYLDPHNDKEPWSMTKEKDWMNVDLYVGGAEHAVLHLLYSRFWHKVLFDLGYVTTKEPFKKLRHQGTVLARTYSDSVGKYHEYSEIELKGEDAFLKATGEKLKCEIEKMAKSKLNGINPDDVIKQYGADTLRMYEMFMGDFELPKPWDPRSIEGCNRFLRRVYRLVDEFDAAKAPSTDIHERLRHRTIKQVHVDLDRMQFNTAIARLMEYINELSSKGATKQDLDILIRLLAPYAPHICDELWEKLGKKGFIIDQAWPVYDEALTVFDIVTIVIQVNGKLKGEFSASSKASQEELKVIALSHDKIKHLIDGKTIKKVIVVPSKLVNIVAV
jgi:leucyl-tRNA synthetase